MSCKHLNHLVEVLFSLNLKPGRFISEANITPILSPECTEYTAIAILRRYGVCVHGLLVSKDIMSPNILYSAESVAWLYCPIYSWKYWDNTKRVIA